MFRHDRRSICAGHRRARYRSTSSYERQLLLEPLERRHLLAGSALLFDGADDVAQVPHSPALSVLETTDTLTIEAWIQVRDWDGDWFSVIDGGQWTIQIHRTTGLQIDSFGGGASSGWVPELDRWYHIAVSISSTESLVRFFADGALVLEVSAEIDLPDSTAPLQLGRNPFANLEYSNGAMDELRIWSVARTPTEIANHWNRGLTGQETGLVGYYRFDESGGRKLHDSAGSAGTGTLGDGPASTEPSWINSGAVFVIPTHIRWTNPDGGMFHDAANWEGGIVPGPEHTAVFDTPDNYDNYTVTFASDATTDRLLVSNGLVSFDLQGFTYFVTNPSEASPSILINGSQDPATPAAINVLDGVIESNVVVVGLDDGGGLAIASNARVVSTIGIVGQHPISAPPDGPGYSLVIVDGQWEVRHALIVGLEGRGEIFNFSGTSGTIVSPWIGLGLRAGSFGSVSLHSDESLLKIDNLPTPVTAAAGELHVGGFDQLDLGELGLIQGTTGGTARVEASDGARIEVARRAQIWDEGEIRLDADGFMSVGNGAGLPAILAAREPNLQFDIAVRGVRFEAVSSQPLARNPDGSFGVIDTAVFFSSGLAHYDVPGLISGEVDLSTSNAFENSSTALGTLTAEDGRVKLVLPFLGTSTLEVFELEGEFAVDGKLVGYADLETTDPSGRITFELDPELSFVELDASFLGLPFVEQLPGSMLTHFSGFLVADITPGQIHFPGGGLITAVEQPGPFSPSFSAVPGQIQIWSDGTLRGAGDITGSVINEGVLSMDVGDGTLHIDGDFEQGEFGRIELGVAGLASESFDQLHVTGLARLGGDLRVVPRGGFLIDFDQRFDPIMTSSGVEGRFEQVIGVGLPAQLAPRVDYGTANLALTTVRPEILVSVDSLTTSEDGSSASFEFVLSVQPTSSVSITLASSDSTEGVVAPRVVMFTPDNWFAPQSAIVTGVADTIEDGSQPYQVVFGDAISEDSAYAGQRPANIPVVNTNVEVAKIAGARLELEAGPIVLAGDNLVLHVFVSDLRPAGLGVQSAYFHVLYEPELYAVDGPIEFGPHFTAAQQGDVSTAGRIAGVGAAQDGSVQDGEVLLFSIPLRALRRGTHVLRIDEDEPIQIELAGSPANPELHELKLETATTKIVAPVGVVVGSDAPLTRIGTTDDAGFQIQISNIGDGNELTPNESTNLNGVVYFGSGPPFDNEIGSFSLPDGDELDLGVPFAATTREERPFTFSVVHSNGHSSGTNQPEVFELNLIGQGVGPIYVSSIAPESRIEFGEVELNDLVQVPFVISNVSIDENGGSSMLTDLTLLSMTIVGMDADEFSLDGFTPGMVLAKGESLELTLQFRPHFSVGSKIASLEILTDQGTAFGLNGETFTHTLAGQALADENPGDSDLPTIQIADTQVSEGDFGNKQIEFKVSLSAPATQQVIVQFTTVEQTALAGLDFVSKQGSIVFETGEQMKSLTVTIVGDLVFEPDELFFVQLHSPQNATLQRGTATGTILNDDTLQTLPSGSVTIRLHPESDSGVSANDRLTNVIRPQFIVGVGTAGELKIDFDGDGTIDWMQNVVPSTFTVAGPNALSDGGHLVTASLQVAGFEMQQATEIIFIDTRPPTFLPSVSPAGTALQFDGVDDLAAFPPGPVLATLEALDVFTIEAWIQVHDWHNDWFSIVDRGTWTIQINRLSGLQLAGAGTTSSSGWVPELDRWYHVSVAYSQSEGTIWFLVDGQLVTEQSLDVDLPMSSMPLLLGYNPFGAEEFSNGKIDELRLWNTVRRAEQVASTWNRSLVDNEPGLIGYFRFDEGSGGILHDLAGGIGPGTLGSSQLDSLPAWVGSGARLERELHTTPVDSLSVRFSEPIHPGSFLPTQSHLSGPGIDGVRPLLSVAGEGADFRVGFDPVRLAGEYTLRVGGGIRDLAGNEFTPAVQEVLFEILGDAPSALSGRIFEDVNGNGRWDAMEPGLSDVRIFLLPMTPSGDVVRGEGRQALTDDAGRYDFELLSGGRYRIEVDNMSLDTELQMATRVEVLDLLLGAGEQLEDVAIGYFKTGRLSGRYFMDFNGDGIWDSDEPPLAGIEVQIESSVRGRTLARTDTQGRFGVSNLLPASYRVNVDLAAFPFAANADIGAGENVAILSASSFDMGEVGIPVFDKKSLLKGQMPSPRPESDDVRGFEQKADATPNTPPADLERGVADVLLVMTGSGGGSVPPTEENEQQQPDEEAIDFNVLVPPEPPGSWTPPTDEAQTGFVTSAAPIRTDAETQLLLLSLSTTDEPRLLAADEGDVDVAHGDESGSAARTTSVPRLERALRPNFDGDDGAGGLSAWNMTSIVSGLGGLGVLMWSFRFRVTYFVRNAIDTLSRLAGLR